MRHSTIYYTPIALIGILYFILVIWVLPQETFYSPDNGIKYMQLKEMLRQGVMNPHLEYPGHKIDTMMKFSPYNLWLVDVKGDKVFSHFDSFFPWLSSLFYALMGPSGLYFIPALSSFLSMIVMYKSARRFFNEKISLTCSILLGLGTPIFFYSLSFWEHSFAFLITMITLLVSLKIIEGKSIYILLFPPLIIFSMFIRSESILFIFSILAAGSIVFWKEIKKLRRIMFVTCVTSSILMAAYIAFNLKTNGTLLGIHISKYLTPDFVSYWVIHRTLVPDINRAKVIFSLFVRSGIGQGVQLTSVLAAAVLLFIFPVIVLIRKNERLLNNNIVNFSLFLSLLVFIFTAIINIYNHSTLVGIFQVTPFIIFSLFVFLENDKDRHMRYIKLSTMIYFIIILFIPFYGETQWGPRLILYIYPLLIILCWKAMPIIKKKFKQPFSNLLHVSFFALLLLSFIIQTTGVTILHTHKKHQMDVEALLAVEPTGVIISAFENTLPTYYARNYSEKLFFCANNENVDELIKLLYQKDINRFSVTSFKSYVNGKKIDTSILSNIKMSDSKNVYLVKNMYRDPKNKKGLVLSVFEIR